MPSLLAPGAGRTRQRAPTLAADAAAGMPIRASYTWGVLKWIRGRASRASVPAPRPRLDQVTRVELAELAPSAERYLGQAAYLSLALFENLSRVVSTAPTTTAKVELSAATAPLIQAHRGFVDELTGRRLDPAAEMEPFRLMIDEFQRRTRGADWFENLVTCYLTTGFLVDFFLGLAEGLPDDVAAHVAELGVTADLDSIDDVLADRIRHEIDVNPRLASRLAMWGRRLLGDTLLVARAAFVEPHHVEADHRVEPVFTELIAGHTRRMSAVGLTP